MSTSEPVRREETSLFHDSHQQAPARGVLGQRCCLQILFGFFFLLTAYLTSRHSITVARLGKGFGMTVA